MQLSRVGEVEDIPGPRASERAFSSWAPGPTLIADMSLFSILIASRHKPHLNPPANGPALTRLLLLLKFPNPTTISSIFPGSKKNMRYLHTMLRVRNLDAALKFYQDALGLKEVRRVDNDKAKFTLVFLCAAEDEGLLKASRGRGAPLVELTYNWDEEKYGEDRYFGHLAYEVDDIYTTCERLMKLGITINRPPRDGQMAFVRSPDLHSIELLQKGDAKPPAEPWASMPNTGHW
jgi:lactoylglutathione lyase